MIDIRSEGVKVKLVKQILLEVVDDLGLFVQLPDIHHPLGELPASSVNHLVPHHHLPPGVNCFLLGQSIDTHQNTII